MKLFKIENEKLSSVSINQFLLEKEIQELIEKNVNELFELSKCIKIYGSTSPFTHS